MQLMDCVGDLVVGGVKVRRDADAGAGAKVGEDLTTAQLGGDFPTVRDVEDDCAAAGCGIAWAPNRQPCLIRKGDEVLRLALRFGADCSDADLANDLIAGT